MPPDPKPHLPSHQHQNLLSNVQSLFSNLNRLFQSPNPIQHFPKKPIKIHPIRTKHHKQWKPKPKSSLPTSTSTENQQVLDHISSDEAMGEIEVVTSTRRFSSPRCFSTSVKEQCWEKAEKVEGRDPDRWRKDPFGNVVFRKFERCRGVLGYEFDHIVLYKEGGRSTLENCQVLQSALNRAKGRGENISRARFANRSSPHEVTGRDMDLIELTTYGDVNHTDELGNTVARDVDLIELAEKDNINHTRDSGGCNIQ
ncbi:hypothetical protein Droror1_Dr00012250 [Drosera rotundifolia]